jgi:prevent-host-death family protein
MVMTKPTSPRRLSVSEAKAMLSDAVRAAAEGPVVIHSRGRDVAALVSMQSFSDLQQGGRAGARFLSAVAELKRRHGGGAVLELERARIRPNDPFASTRARKRRG